MSQVIQDCQRSYAIVRFNNETRRKKASVDLVCGSWLHNDKDGPCCFYPPRKDWPKLDEWLCNHQKPLKNWIKYSDVTVLAEADNYDQGMRRLHRSFQRDYCLRSSDSESRRKSQSSPISVAEAKHMLKQTRSLFDGSTIVEDSEEERASNDSESTTGKSNRKSPPKSPTLSYKTDDMQTPTRYGCIHDSVTTLLSPQNSSDPTLQHEDLPTSKKTNDGTPDTTIYEISQKIDQHSLRDKRSVNSQETNFGADDSDSTGLSVNLKGNTRTKKRVPFRRNDQGKNLQNHLPTHRRVYQQEVDSDTDSPHSGWRNARHELQRKSGRRKAKIISSSDEKSPLRSEKEQPRSINSEDYTRLQQRGRTHAKFAWSAVSTGKDSDRGGNVGSEKPPSFKLSSPFEQLPRFRNSQSESTNPNQNSRTQESEELFNTMAPSMKDFARYLDLQREADTEKILKTFNNVKRSILYDLTNMVKNLNDIITATHFANSMSNSSVRPLISEILKVKFPISNYEDYIAFDDSLQAIHEERKDEEGKTVEYSGLQKQKALLSMFRGWVGTEDTWKDCVKKCINRLLQKDVQKYYSGQGRKTSLSKKESFSKTATYECLRDFLLKKFPTIEMNIIQYVGHHLSQAQRKD